MFDKGILLSQVNGVIFAPEGFKEYQKSLSTSTGVVPLSKLASLFPYLNSDMICQFLCHLEFCQDITDPEILVLLHANTNVSASDEKFLFFPGLVDMNIPSDVWTLNSQFGYHNGWLLQCTKPEQFLSPRFLQVLLLQLAYNLAFVQSEKNSLDSNESSLKRNCYVWKCGICWSDTTGVEIIVEIVNQKNVVVLTRSLKQIESHTKLTFIRSQIIKRVLDTKNELCHKIAIKESLLHPADTTSYPLDLTQVKVVKMNRIANAVVEAKLGVLDSDNQMVDLKSGLLCFEPYIGLNQSILEKLFKENDYNMIVEDGFFFDVAECIHKNIDYITELFQPSQIRLANLMDHAPPGDIHKIVRVFQLWRDDMGAEGTQYNLRKKIGSV